MRPCPGIYETSGVAGIIPIGSLGTRIISRQKLIACLRGGSLTGGNPDQVIDTLIRGGRIQTIQSDSGIFYQISGAS